MKNVVSTQWIHENIHAKNLVILDCRFDLNDSKVGKQEYDKSHIEGAYFLDLEKDLSGIVEEHGGKHPLPQMDEFIKKLEALGISNDTTVIIYDKGDFASAARLWWMLKFIGLENIYVLEGGFSQWEKDEYEKNNVSINLKNKGKINPSFKTEKICKMEDVRESISDKNTIIIDSRANERYTGEVEPIHKKAGHIPSAVNYFWQNVLTENKLKSLAELELLFNDLKMYKKIIVHCGSGVTACPNLLAMDEIGIDAILYLGGWSDWISYNENEIV